MLPEYVLERGWAAVSDEMESCWIRSSGSWLRYPSHWRHYQWSRERRDLETIEYDHRHHFSVEWHVVTDQQGHSLLEFESHPHLLHAAIRRTGNDVVIPEHVGLVVASNLLQEACKDAASWHFMDSSSGLERRHAELFPLKMLSARIFYRNGRVRLVDCTVSPDVICTNDYVSPGSLDFKTEEAFRAIKLSSIFAFTRPEADGIKFTSL